MQYPTHCGLGIAVSTVGWILQCLVSIKVLVLMYKVVQLASSNLHNLVASHQSELIAPKVIR